KCNGHVREVAWLHFVLSGQNCRCGLPVNGGKLCAMSTATETKWVYLFSEGSKDMRDLLGGKGAGVAEMTRAGMPVPPGFTITTEACRTYYQLDREFPEGLWEQVAAARAEVEEQTGKRLGDESNPLPVSV